MKHSRLQRSSRPSSRIKRLTIKSLILFISGLLLTIISMKFGWGFALGQSDAIAPVFRHPTAQEQALQKRPLPLNSNVTVPDEVKVCMGSSGERFDLLGTVQDADKTYYLLAIYQDFVHNNPLDAYDELIETDAATGCARLATVNSISQPLSVYMSKDAAQALEVQRYQRYISLLGGASQLQRSLAEHISAARGSYLLSAEQVHALQQLQVSVPDGYRLLTADTFSTL